MKLLSFETDGRARVGVSLPEGMLDLTGALSITHPQLDRTDSLLAMIQSHIDIDAFGEESVQRLRREQRLRDHLVGNFKWLPPIPRPPKILALALNYREHIEESKLSFFDEPIIFAKYANNLIAHDDEIVLPPFPQQVDEEHELALVVGRDCRHIRPSQASGYIFGYTICNDVSARDRQRERLRMGQPYAYAKNFATFCPMGPWIVTANEIGDPRKLNMTVRVNGETRRTGNTSAMIFDPYEVLAYCSDYTLMEAGDIISLGTYSGNKRLAPGDVLELETEKIGVLRNRVVAAPEQWRNFTAGQPTGPLVKEK